jgi:hypothetical protein
MYTVINDFLPALAQSHLQPPEPVSAHPNPIIAEADATQPAATVDRTSSSSVSFKSSMHRVPCGSVLLTVQGPNVTVRSGPTS